MDTFTRDDYMAKRCTHEQYYGQFVTEGARNIVAQRIGLDKIKASTDEHFNDIPLVMWDSLLQPMTNLSNRALREAGDYPTLCSAVCIAKQAARQIKASS